MLIRKNIKPGSKISIWNAVIGSTLKYALDTQELEQVEQKSPIAVALICIKEIHGPKWKGGKQAAGKYRAIANGTSRNDILATKTGTKTRTQTNARRMEHPSPTNVWYAKNENTTT